MISLEPLDQLYVEALAAEFLSLSTEKLLTASLFRFFAAFSCCSSLLPLTCSFFFTVFFGSGRAVSYGVQGLLI